MGTLWDATKREKVNLQRSDRGFLLKPEKLKLRLIPNKNKIKTSQFLKIKTKLKLLHHLLNELKLN